MILFLTRKLRCPLQNWNISYITTELVYGMLGELLKSKECFSINNSFLNNWFSFDKFT